MYVLRSIPVLLIVPMFMLIWQSPIVAQEEKMKDPVVVSCDGTEYTQSQVLQEIDELAVEFSGQMSPQQMAQKNVLLFKPAVDRIISQQLIVKAAKEEKIEVKPEDVQTKIDELAAQYPSKELFEQLMSQRGLDMDTLQEIMHRNLQLEGVIIAKQGEFKAPTEEEIQVYYTENISQYKQPEQVRASHILLKTDTVNSADEKAKIKKQLEQIALDIKSGKTTFAAAATEHSHCPSSAQGGDLSYFGKGQMVKPFEDVAFSGKTGDISGIVETQFGYHIIQVTDKKEAKTFALTEVKENIVAELSESKKREAMEEFLQKARAEANVVIKVSEAEWKQQQGEKLPIQLDQ